jgi:O-antigen/teichoic acid export membrane protein
LPLAASGWVNSFSDRLVLAKYTTMQDVGLFSLAYQAAMVLYVIMDAITQVQSPMAMSGLIYDKEATLRKLGKFITVMLTVLVAAHLSLTYFAKEIVLAFANKKYFHAYKVIGIIGTIYVFGGLQRPIADIISFHKKTWVLSSGVFISAFLNLGLNIIFVPYYGYFASAFVTCISTLFYVIWLYFWVFKFEKIHLEVYKSLTITFIYVLALVIYYTIFFDKAGITIFLFKTLFFILNLILLYILIIKWFAKDKEYNPIHIIKKIVS